MAKQLVDKILEYLDRHTEANSLELTNIFKEDHQKIIGAIKSIEAAGGDLIAAKQVNQKKWEITSEGQHIINHGSHEATVYNAIPDNGMPQSEIMKSVPFAKVGFSKAIVAGWIELDKSTGTPIVRKKLPSITDTTQVHLQDFENLPENLKNDYKKRKLLQEIIIKSVQIRKGTNFSRSIEKLETELTGDLLANGGWKEKKFKPYNFAALGSALEIGHLHPLLKVRSEFRKIFLEMGFTEMPTNNYVESSFWNFDALFQPQQHPARDAHDTFFISEPRISTNLPMEYLERVKKIHSEGGYGSQGYCYDWKIEEAQKNLLRTHTTAVSARMLYKLMKQNDNFKPVKYFSIDRVFRNETLDATHLAEFHQVEGVVADYNLTLGDLIGILYEFFKKLGITQLQFKPAYNPYTEPSMEIFCYHNGLKKWIEIGNSGMFRPEMLLPMGLPKDVNVIAWGLSLERPTMIKYGLNNIRDLVGPKVDLEMVYNNPICRLDKTSRQVSSRRKQPEALEEEKSNESREHQSGGTNEFKKDTKLLLSRPIEKQDLVIFCDPNYSIIYFFLQSFFRITKPFINVLNLSTYIHSSVSTNSVPKNLLKNLSWNHRIAKSQDNNTLRVDLAIIWKEVGLDPIMQLPGSYNNKRILMGEVNIARYLNRLIEICYPTQNILLYESGGVLYANEIDSYLDTIHSTLHASHAKAKPYPCIPNIKKNNCSTEQYISIADIMLESVEKCKSVKK